MRDASHARKLSASKRLLGRTSPMVGLSGEFDGAGVGSLM
jgi:hypothetical protein